MTWGKRALSKGGGVLLGLEDSPFPNMLMTRMKYFRGSKAMPGPISQSFSQWRPACSVSILRCTPESFQLIWVTCYLYSKFWATHSSHCYLWAKVCSPLYHVGYTMALLLSSVSVPHVLYASFAFLSVIPQVSLKSPRSYIS